MASAASAFGPRNTGATGPKILVIGLNRCATTSLHRLFENSGIASLHWRRETDERNIALTMLTNLSLGRAPLDGFAGVRAFSDLAHVDGRQVVEGARFFRALHTAYEDAYFILNTRPVDDWTASRLAHAGGSYLTRSMKATGLDQQTLVDSWRALFATHEAEVTAHFAGNPRFLRFDISRDDPQAIADLVAPDFALDLTHWGQSNRRPDPILSTGPGADAPRPDVRHFTGG